MEKIKVKSITDYSKYFYFIVCLVFTAFLPFFIHIQWITGPIINAILILVLLIVDFRSALIVSVIPSIMALSGGLLPFFLAPIIPFIILGNIIFVTTVKWFFENIKDDKKGYWIGVILGALIKYILIFASAILLKYYVIEIPFTTAITQLLSWSQFYTAVIGGSIAYLILIFLKKFN